MNKKILSLVAILVCFFGLVSCEGDDDGGNYVVPNYVAGKWELQEIGALNAQNVLNFRPVVSTDCEDQAYTFTEEMAYTKNYSEIVEGACTAKTQNGTYSITNGNIVLTYTDATSPDPITKTLDILVLTNTTLQVAYPNPATNKLVFLKFSKLNIENL